MPKLDIPLDALKLVAQTVPSEQAPHTLTWTEESGFVLNISMQGQMVSVRFDYGETLEDIKREIQMVTGIPMPSEEKGGDGKAPTSAPGVESKTAGLRTPFLDRIKAATGAADNVNNYLNQRDAAYNELMGGGSSSRTTPTRTTRTLSSGLSALGNAVRSVKPR